MSFLEAFETQNEDWKRFKASVDNSMNYLQDNYDLAIKNCQNGVIHLLKNAFETEEISKIVNDLIIAAADTTSYTTLWTLYLIGLHKGQNFTSREASKESMRLFPVAPFLTRIQQTSLELEGDA